MKKTVLITGAKGSIGAELCKYLEKKYNLLKIVRQPENKKKYYSFNTIKNYNKDIDTIIHLAGFNPEPYLKLKNENEMYRKNVAIHKEVIKIIRKNNVKKVIFFSSFSLYAYNKIITEKSNIKIKNLYSKSKLWMEIKLLKENISSYILRSSAIIFKETSNNWISQIISKISKNEKITLFNKRNIYNNCLLISDLKKIIIKCINRKSNKEKKIYNISSNQPISIDEIKKIIKKNKYYSNDILVKNKKSVKDFFNDSSIIQKDFNLKFKSTRKTLSSVLSVDLRKKLIILGSNGYLGNFFKKELKKTFKIISVNRKNFNSFFRIKTINETLNSSVILYLAIINSKKNFFRNNLYNLKKIINKIPPDNINKFLLFSSAHSHDTEYLKFNKIREKIIKAKFNDKVYILSPGKVYGEKIVNTNYGINSFLYDLKEKKIKIFGKGNNYCPHTYIKDLTKVIKVFTFNEMKRKKYFIYDNKKINFLNIAKKIKTISNNEKKIRFTYLGKSLKYKIKKPSYFDKKLFIYSDMFANLKKIIYEKKL